MSWYRTGTISLTNGSVDVTGVGTAFSSEVRFSDILLVNGALYEIVRVLGDTTLKLSTPYAGATAADVPFAVIRNLTNASNYELMKRIEEFLTDRQRSMDELADWINGLPGAGPTANGVFPLTDRYGITVHCKSPKQLEADFSALSAQQNGLISQTQTALTDAEARLAAIGNQQAWADQILGYKNAAAASATKAGQWAENAENTEVELGKYSAKHHAIKATASATAAATSKTGADTAKTAAETAKTAAETARTGAQTAETNALASKNAAATSASTASTKATEAASSATAASTSATSASASEVKAGKWAEEVENTAVETGKYSAKHHALKAAASAAGASGSASTATTKAGEASTSAANAAASATTATTKAGEASTSATNAAASASTATTKATEASTSATTAGVKATEASNSATSASTSSTKAGQWADASEDVLVETGKYSAKHHATKAAASATAANASQTAAGTSATTASTKAAEASTSASNAVGSATTATTKASEAAASATNAANANTAAQSAKTAAEAARDEAVTAASSLTGTLSELGSVDLSSGAYPITPTSAGFWKVTVGGTVGGVDYGVGDTLVYSKNLDQFYKIDNTESVSSVNGKTGAAVLNAADVGAVSTTGNAASATKLATARTINGVAFDGTANITVVDSTKEPAFAAGTTAQYRRGDKTWQDLGAAVRAAIMTGLSTATATAVVATDTALAAVGKLQAQITGLSSSKLDATGSAASLTNIPADQLSGVVPDANLSGVYTGVSIDGNAGTATKLATARTINGVAFDGTADITVADSTKAAVGSVVPSAPGTAAAGVATTAARSDHIHPLQTTVSGNAGTATALQTGRTLGMTGDVTWTSPSFNGSANVTAAATLANSGVAAGTYKSVTVDAKGRVTAGANPTTVAGYGIADAQLAARTSATFTTTAGGWYRIATSPIDIGRNSAEFVVDWSVSGAHGCVRFAAGCHYGQAAGVSLMQVNYSAFGQASGITEARIVYHATYTGNYAYVEVKFGAALTSVAVAVEMQDALGWSLVAPSTAGSIPAGYSAYNHVFVPSAAIVAGTFGKVTINQEGRVTAGAALLASDIPTLNQSTTGNAATATALQTARTINGVSFNGTANITVADATKLPLTGGTLTGFLTGTRAIFSGTGNDYETGALEARGNGATNTVFPTVGFHQPGLYASSIQLRASGDFRFYQQGAGAYASVTASQFNGSGAGLTAVPATQLSGIVPDANLSGTYTGVSITGNAATATALQTARTINGVSFNGTANITVTASDPGSINKTGDTITGKISVGVTTARSAGMYGIYDSTKTGHIWSMGTAYAIPDDGSTFGTLYGMAYKHTANTTGGTMAGGHQIVFCSAGTAGAAIGLAGGIWTSGNVTAYSDIRVKTNIEVIPDALNKVMQIRGVTYDRIDRGGERQVGVIAQEVQAVLPEAVSGDDMLSVAYGNLAGLFVEAIKELSGKVDNLQAELAELKRAA